MNKKKELKYNAWNKHLNNTRERTNYSIKRMDILVISICGGGIYIIFETLREFKTGGIKIEFPVLLILTGVSLLLAIMTNFISQITGYVANDTEEKFIYLELKKIDGKKIDKCEQDAYNKKVTKFNLLTDIFNISSITLMFIGLVLLAIFNYLLI